MKIYWDLFISFFKIGLFTVGGGYAMLPMIQREMLKHKWANEKEVLDYYALSQVTPGIIAVNVSTFVGYKVKGVKGALCTILGIVLPSVMIITPIAFGLVTIWSNPMVLAAFHGIQLMIPALILPIVIRMMHKNKLNMETLLIMVIAFVGALLDQSRIVLLVLCGLFSLTIYAITRRQK